MKKNIVIICILVISILGYWGYSKYKVENLKTAVVEHLGKQGFTSEDYSSPKYVQDKSLKGYKSDNIEIIFKEESNYTYYYIKEKGEIKVFYALNENTREEDYNKKEPLK